MKTVSVFLIDKGESSLRATCTMKKTADHPNEYPAHTQRISSLLLPADVVVDAFESIKGKKESIFILKIMRFGKNVSIDCYFLYFYLHPVSQKLEEEQSLPP